MLTFRTSASMLEAAKTYPDPELRRLLTGHIDRLADFDDYDLAELMQVFIVEPGDTLASLEAARGWPFAEWEFIQGQGGWFEAVFIISDDGFGHLVFIPDCPAIEPALLAMCRREASDPGG